MTIPEEQKIKLESMQIKGIRWMIWNNIEKELIESRLLQIKGQSTTSDLTKLVNSQSRATLIQLIERSPEITVSITLYSSNSIMVSPHFSKLSKNIIQENKWDVKRQSAFPRGEDAFPPQRRLTSYSSSRKIRSSRSP